jgi:hypothetical protein
MAAMRQVAKRERERERKGERERGKEGNGTCCVK